MPKVLENIQLGFTACRIGMRKCWQWLRCYRPIIIVRDQYQILCLGLTGAGKSTALATLVGEPTENIEPTTGFNIKTLPLKDTVLDIKELGGSENIRPFWNRYFHGLHGLLYVVNAAQEDSEMENAADGLQTVLSDSSLKGIPCLILATHEDVMGAWTQEQAISLSIIRGSPRGKTTLQAATTIHDHDVSALAAKIFKPFSSLFLASEVDVEHSYSAQTSISLAEKKTGGRQQEIEQVFQPILHGRKWKVQLCGLQDRNSIQQACEILIDLMSGID